MISFGTLLETVCKHVLEDGKTQYPDNADLSKLWSLTAEVVNLPPAQHQKRCSGKSLDAASLWSTAWVPSATAWGMLMARDVGQYIRDPGTPNWRSIWPEQWLHISSRRGRKETQADHDLLPD